MSDFDAIDSLLAGVRPQAELPSSQVRRELRERARLPKAQVARALGASPSTVAGWEGGRNPVGETRSRYAYLLDGLAAKFAADTAQATPAATEPAVAQPRAAVETPPPSPAPEEGGEGGEAEALAAPEPCVLCGHAAGTRVAGFAQHLDAADCQTLAAATSAPPAAPPMQPGSAPAGKPSPRAPRTQRPSGCSQGLARRVFQEPSGPGALIGQAVQGALAEHQGDAEAAMAVLLKQGIPDAVRLLDEACKGARCDVIAHPWIPGVLRRQTCRGVGQIWEARPKRIRCDLPPG